MPGKVLIADDSLRIQKELTQLLEKAGIEVATVSNGEHAVRQLPRLKPDLVLADIFMPVRTGYEVCSYVKDNPDFSHTAVLLLASRMEPFDQQEAQRAGADGKIDKPFEDTAAVLATIKKHLQRVLATKPPPSKELAASVPAADQEPEPQPAAEPEPELFATRPPLVEFDKDTAPMGFADMVEEEAQAKASVEPAGAEEDALDLSQTARPSSEADLKQPLEEARTEPEEMAAPSAEEDLPMAEVITEEQLAAAKEETRVEKPELAAAWEMTGPQPGAPEIPPVGGFESQWSGGEGEAEPSPVAQEEPAPPAEPVAEGEAVPAAEAGQEEPVAVAGLGEELSAAVAGVPASTQIDPALLDEVVNQVLERLSPQVMETFAREIVRPLAEALLKERLKE